MWTCPFHPPVQLYFIIRNTERSPDFQISRIKIWNYNKSINVRDQTDRLSMKRHPISPYVVHYFWPEPLR